MAISERWAGGIESVFMFSDFGCGAVMKTGYLGGIGSIENAHADR
jgi:hypothetical protein